MVALDVAPELRGEKDRNRPWSSRRWRDYFDRDRPGLLAIPWERGAEWTRRERDLVGPSLRIFQQGEAQQGDHFYRCARAYAEASGDPDYAEAHRLFMNEERRHGRDLGRFLELAGVPVLTKTSWLTRAFCWCGSRGGLEATLRVILICEMLALAYYQAVGRATRSAVLRRLCAQILRDEKQHIRFHCDRLALMRATRSTPRLALTLLLDRTLLVAAVVVLWCGHGRVLRAGGFDPWTFWSRTRRVSRTAAALMNPRRCPSS